MSESSSNEECLHCHTELDNNAPRSFCNDECEQAWALERHHEIAEKTGNLPSALERYSATLLEPGSCRIIPIRDDQKGK